MRCANGEILLVVIEMREENPNKKIAFIETSSYGLSL